MRWTRLSVGLVTAAALAGNVPEARQIPAAQGAEAVALDLCKDYNSNGPPLTLVGSRAQWSQAVLPDTAPALVSRIIATLNQSPSLVVAANGPYVAVHDTEALTLLRVKCGAASGITRRTAFPARQVAVSEVGDVAVQSSTGATQIYPGTAWRSDSAPERGPFTAPEGTRPSPMAWIGQQLLLFGDDAVLQLATREGASLSVMTPRREHPVPIRDVFSYNGLTYARAADGCLDIYVFDALQPRVRRVACMSAGQVATTYLSFDSKSMQLFSNDGASLWQGPRLIALTGRLSGTVREITANLQTIATEKWLPTVPLPMGSNVSMSQPDDQSSTRQWNTVFDRAQWSSQDAYKKGTTALGDKGYSDLHDEGGWTSGVGIAFRWQVGAMFVQPAGRTLTAIAKELYFDGKYSDTQIENVLSSNALLGRSLEGRLSQSRWLPIGAALRPSSRGPYAFVGALMLGSAANWRIPQTAVNDCDRSTEEPVPNIAEAVRNGIDLLGRAGQPEDQKAPEPKRVQLRAGDAYMVSCARPGTRAIRLLFLRNVELAGTDLARIPEPQQTQTVIRTTGGLRYTRGTDINWPVRVTGDVVAGVAVESLPPDGKTTLMRSWLDDLAAHERVERLLLPVSFLELAVAADVSWQEKAEAIPKVILLSAERVRAAKRADQCDTDEQLLGRQKAYESLVALKDVSARDVDMSVVGVVENAVNLQAPLFKRANQEPVWVRLNDHQHFETLTTVPTMSLNPEDLLHGTRVAGLLFSKALPMGVLSDVRLTWLNAAAPNTEVLLALAGRNDILNVSQKLPDRPWNELKPTAENDLRTLLFVAAARNKQEDDDGLPIAWNLPNTIGVGVATHEGTTPPNVLAFYSSKTVDVVAPGFLVPAFGDPKGECVDGTSFAAAYVSALAALVQQKAGGTMTAMQLRARLMATSTWTPDYIGRVKGGLIRADYALALDQNILKLQSGADTLDLSVRVDDKLFSVTGQDLSTPQAPASNKTVFWSEVLRLMKTGEATDPQTGRKQSIFYLVFIKDGKYTTFANARISALTSMMPVTSCSLRAGGGGEPPSCELMDVNKIVDYIAQRSRLDVRVF